MDYTGFSVKDFVRELASDAPVPGGGGASAVAGALGIALGNMVAALTAGRKKYADVEEEILALRGKCVEIQQQLLEQVEADAKGFAPLAAAYAIPRDDPRRGDIIEEASEGACAAPLAMMHLIAEAIEAMHVFAEKGSRLAVSDAGAGAALLGAAMQAASLNVFINTRSMRDRERADRINRECSGMLEKYVPMAESVYASVLAGLTGDEKR